MALGIELLFLIVLGLALILALPSLGARWCGLLGAALVAVAVGGSWHAFSAWQWLFDPLYPSLVLVVLYVVETGIIFLRTESERRWVRGAFGRYLSPAVVAQLAENPDQLQLGGEMRDMTLLFCDVRGFAAVSERLDAAGLTRFINRFLTPMTEVILAAGGTIDKYMGDAIMAFWGAPVADPAHVLKGCQAALAMRTALVDLNRRLAAEAEAEGRPHIPVNVGIGLNTGVCCVGNMGSDQRFDYSVLGDDVNLASRLEGQSKTYGVDVVISESTRDEAGPDLDALELDLIQVKGKTRPVRIYALAGPAGRTGWGRSWARTRRCWRPTGARTGTGRRPISRPAGRRARVADGSRRFTTYMPSASRPSAPRGLGPTGTASISPRPSSRTAGARTRRGRMVTSGLSFAFGEEAPKGAWGMES